MSNGVSDKRQYVRMKTVIPVEVQLLAPDGTSSPSKLLQAFTRDISAGGLCLELKSFGPQTENFLHAPGVFFQLTINPPFSTSPIQAVAKIAWIHREEKFLPVHYTIGVSYTQIDARARRRLVNYAKRLLWVPRLVGVFVVVILAFLAQVSLHNQKMIFENKRLVSEIVLNAEGRSQVMRNLNDLSLRKDSLEKELSKAKAKIASLESSLASASSENEDQKISFRDELKKIGQTQGEIVQQLQSLQESRQKLELSYETYKNTAAANTTSTLQQMAGWLKSHQNLKTGLVASFEGDAGVEDEAFTYDQSLASQVFLLLDDAEKAAAILDFYDQRAEREDGAFFNAYGTQDGRPAEQTVHSGPNLWIGIAAAQYEKKMKDGRFLPLAESVGQWAIRSQDDEGGLKGGPGLSWYSTEHHLDAYALFGMLFRLTNDVKYRDAREKVLDWIKKYAYSVEEKRMNRGKGDSTIATDTFSWAVAAIGPEKLKESGFDAEAIMEFAKNHCEVTVEVPVAGGAGQKVKVTGFDFARAQNVGRGGVISTEWTAQVVVSYKVLSDAFRKAGDQAKAASYSEKVNFYLNELQKLLVTSPSRVGQGRGCLPYASMDDVDTGHGWRTPKGRLTGSVAGTAYGVFAWMGYNPFEFKE